MRKFSSLADKLRYLRAQKGVTIHIAAKEMPGLWKATLQRLEDGIALPERTPVGTFMTLILYYWPHLELRDFTDRPDFQGFSITRQRDELDAR